MRALSMELKDGHIDGHMLWSLADNFPVVTDMAQEFTMTMKNPMDGSRIQVPMTQTIRMNTTLE
jgi:hypothetical protein